MKKPLKALAISCCAIFIAHAVIAQNTDNPSVKYFYALPGANINIGISQSYFSDFNADIRNGLNAEAAFSLPYIKGRLVFSPVFNYTFMSTQIDSFNFLNLYSIKPGINADIMLRHGAHYTQAMYVGFRISAIRSRIQINNTDNPYLADAKIVKYFKSSAPALVAGYKLHYHLFFINAGISFQYTENRIENDFMRYRDNTSFAVPHQSDFGTFIYQYYINLGGIIPVFRK